jgi:hypothetical protein
MLGCAEMLFCPQAMPTHIVVVGCASSFHLLDRFLHMVLASFQVMPIMNPLGDGDPGNKRQARGKNGNCNLLLHVFSSQLCGVILGRTHILTELQPPVKVKQVHALQ